MNSKARIFSKRRLVEPPKRKCRLCGKVLWPWFCNQIYHAECWSEWRKDYQRKYQKQMRERLRAADRAEWLSLNGMARSIPLKK